MPLSTCADLKAAVADWLARTDLAARVPDFVRLAEADVNGRLRLREMEVATALAVAGATVALPAGLLAVRRLAIGGRALVQAGRWACLPPGSGRPSVFAVEGESLRLGPAPDGAYEAELLYVAAPPPLVADEDGHALLAAHPDLYLYGALVHAAPFIGDDERMAVWRTQYEAALLRAVTADRLARMSGAPLSLRGGPVV